MANPSVTYGQLFRLLRDLEFVKQPAKRRWIAFEHSPSGTLFLFAAHSPHARAREVDVGSVRKQLTERGLITAQEFSRRMTLLARKANGRQPTRGAAAK